MATVIVTGASMGIGRAIAIAWARRGATLVLSARGRDALDAVALEVEAEGGKAHVVVGDVTDAAHRVQLVEKAAATGAVDVLVNNAGRGFYAEAMQIDLEQMRALFELNVVAPLHLAQLAVPHLAQTSGAIVMMSSIAGIVAAPRYGAYAASKYALEALSMAMRAELAPRKVRVVVVRPGPVATPFRSNATRAPGVGFDAPDPKAQSPEAVARLTLAAVDRSRPVVETTPFVRVASVASRWAPGPFRLVMRRMARKPR